MIHTAHRDDVPAIVALAKLLWPDCNETELAEEFAASITDTDQKVLVAKTDGQLIGFAHITLRHDHVEGTTTSPVGYLEGIFVLETYRSKGIGRQLIGEAEAWCRLKGCSEMGSDTEIENANSQQFHTNCGFKEVNRIVSFAKKIT